MRRLSQFYGVMPGLRTSILSSLLIIGLGGLTAQSPSLSGVIDIHAHSDPDSTPRSIDALSLGRLAKSRGMRGMVLKNHYEPTASLAWLVRKEVPGLEVFGGIDLNLTVGGINPPAVERMTRVKGGWGRFVWMPTFDAENQVRFSKEKRPFVSVSRDGQLLPAVKEVIALIAKHNLVLATGHSSPAEVLLLLREGRKQGVRHMVVTHAIYQPVLMNIAQMKEAASLGAYIEFAYNGLIGSGKMFEVAQFADAMRQIGIEHCIISSDLGQAGNPLHPDGMAAYMAALHAVGLSTADVYQMAALNPALLLGLPPNK